MIKLIKLDITYTDQINKTYNVFMVINGVKLLEYGDFILDSINLDTSAETIEDYLNNPNVDIDEVNRFTYKIKYITNPTCIEYQKNEHACQFLLSVYRNMQIRNIMNS